MQHLNVFTKYQTNFSFQCEFSSELEMGSKWKVKTISNLKRVFFFFLLILMQSTNAVHDNR